MRLRARDPQPKRYHPALARQANPRTPKRRAIQNVISPRMKRLPEWRVERGLSRAAMPARMVV